MPIDSIVSKASTRLHYLRELKISGLSEKDLLTVYLCIVTSVTEYACQVWSTSLTIHEEEVIESIQRRGLQIIKPSLSYREALQFFGISSLKCRRQSLCISLFNNIQDPSHKLHDLLPGENKTAYSLRHHQIYKYPKCNTNRYASSSVC